MVATRGRRDPAMAAAMVAAPSVDVAQAETVFVVARRPMRQGRRQLQIGDVVDTTGWIRLESWIAQGLIREMPVDDVPPEAYPNDTYPYPPDDL